MEPEDKDNKDDPSVSKQILEYYQKYSQNKELPKYFSGSSMSYMPPIVSDDVEEEAEETKTETLKVVVERDVSEEPKISPASSVTSTKKLEWDNGADIGYNNCQKSLHKSQSLPILTAKNGNGVKTTTQRVTIIPYSSSEDSFNNKSDPITSTTSSSLPQKPEHVSTTSSSTKQPETSLSSSSNPSSFIKRKIGSPNAESTPKNVQNPKKINIMKMVRLCQTKPIVVDCLDRAKELYDKKIQTSLDNVAKSMQTSPVPQNINQSVIELNYECDDLAASRCDSFEYFDNVKNSSESSNKEVPILAQLIEKTHSRKLSSDIDKSVEILEKLLKSKKYDSETKKRYIKKIVKKVVDGKYSGDSTTSSEMFQPKKSQLQANVPWQPPHFSKFTVKTFSEQFVPSTSSYETDKTTSGSWKDDQTLSEQIYQRNIGGGGDSLIKFADQERQQQLSWIKSEITHLTKLQGLLERNQLDPGRKTTTVYMLSQKTSNSTEDNGNQRRNYIIETELPREAGSKLVGDIEVESDAKTTNIKVTTRKPSLVGEGEYESLPQSSQEDKECCCLQKRRELYNVRHYQFQIPLQNSKLQAKVDEVLGRLKQPIERVVGESAFCTINCRKSKNPPKICKEDKVCVEGCECKGHIEYFKEAPKKVCEKTKTCVKDCRCKSETVECVRKPPKKVCSKKICPDNCKCKERAKEKPKKVCEKSKVCIEKCECKQQETIDYFGKYTLDLADKAETCRRGVQCLIGRYKQIETDINVRMSPRRKSTCDKNLQCTACPDANLKDKDVQCNSKNLCKQMQVCSKCQARGVPSQEFGQLDRFVDVAKSIKKCTLCDKCIETDRNWKKDRGNQDAVVLKHQSTQDERLIKEQIVGTHDYTLDWSGDRSETGTQSDLRPNKRDVATQDSLKRDRRDSSTQDYREGKKETGMQHDFVETEQKKSESVKSKGQEKGSSSTNTERRKCSESSCKDTHKFIKDWEDRLKQQSSHESGTDKGKQKSSHGRNHQTNMKSTSSEATGKETKSHSSTSQTDTYRKNDLKGSTRETDPKAVKDGSIIIDTLPVRSSFVSTSAGPSQRRPSASQTAGSGSSAETGTESTAQEHKSTAPKPVQMAIAVAQTSRTTSADSAQTSSRRSSSRSASTDSEGLKDRSKKQTHGDTKDNVQSRMCECCGCKEILERFKDFDAEAMKMSLCRDLLSQMVENRPDSSTSSSDSDSSISSCKSCACCKRRIVKEKQLYALRKKLSDQTYPLCSPCYRQNRRGFYPQNYYYQNPGHICRCYSVIQTSTLNEVKQTIYDLNSIDCSCSDSAACRGKCHRKDGKNGVAYMLTFEDGSIQEEPEQQVTKHLDEIKIKIPVYKKKHKDKENKKKKTKKIRKDYKTLQDYLNLNRPNFIQMADGRRQSVMDARTYREKMSDYNKIMFLQNLCQDTKCAYNQRRLYSAKEMRDINRKNYWKLPEVQKKISDNHEKKLRQASKLMADVFNRKLRENALKGKLTIPTDVNVVNI